MLKVKQKWNSSKKIRAKIRSYLILKKKGYLHKILGLKL